MLRIPALGEGAGRSPAGSAPNPPALTHTRTHMHAHIHARTQHLPPTSMHNYHPSQPNELERARESSMDLGRGFPRAPRLCPGSLNSLRRNPHSLISLDCICALPHPYLPATFSHTRAHTHARMHTHGTCLERWLNEERVQQEQVIRQALPQEGLGVGAHFRIHFTQPLDATTPVFE